MSNFQSAIGLPTFKLMIENMSNFDLIGNLIIKVKWLLLIDLVRPHVITQVEDE